MKEGAGERQLERGDREMGGMFEENGITIAMGRWYFIKKRIYKKLGEKALPFTNRKTFEIFNYENKSVLKY